MTLLAGTARSTKRVLIVDDDAAIARMLQDVVGLFRHEHAYTVETADDGVQGLEALERGQFDLVLLDMHMPRMTGLELLGEMRRRGLKTPVLMLTGNEDNVSRGERPGRRHLRLRPQAVRASAPRDAGLAGHLAAVGRRRLIRRVATASAVRLNDRASVALRRSPRRPPRATPS